MIEYLRVAMQPREPVSILDVRGAPPPALILPDSDWLNEFGKDGWQLSFILPMPNCTMVYFQRVSAGSNGHGVGEAVERVNRE